MSRKKAGDMSYWADLHWNRNLVPIRREAAEAQGSESGARNRALLSRSRADSPTMGVGVGAEGGKGGSA